MKKRYLALSAGAVAAIMMLTSTAFACTVFLGQFEVAGNSSNPASSWVKAVGNKTSMAWKSISADYAITKGTSPALGFKIGPDPADASNKLPNDRTYYLRFDNYTGTSDGAFTDHYTWKYDCMAGGYGKTLGSGVTVNSSGYGNYGTGNTYWYRTDTATANRTPWNGTAYYNEAAACISDSSATYGNMAPVTILGS